MEARLDIETKKTLALLETIARGIQVPQNTNEDTLLALNTHQSP